MTGRSILRRTCAQPILIRAMPENEIPPAMRVDYYLKFNLPNGIKRNTFIEGYKRVGIYAITLIFFKGEGLISVKGDTKLIAFLLLEAMYQNKKINEKTFKNIMRMKTQYLEQQENRG